MSRVGAPQPYFSSIEKFLDEQKVAMRSSVRGIPADSTEWIDGYTENAVRAIMERDRYRELRELDPARNRYYCLPSATMRISED
jgi:hypothetical protein